MLVSGRKKERQRIETETEQSRALWIEEMLKTSAGGKSIRTVKRRQRGLGPGSNLPDVWS